MNKAELAAQIAEQMGISKKIAHGAIDSAIDIIIDAIQEGESVVLSGFGVFELKKRAARRARNPQTGQSLIISSTVVPFFRPGHSFKERVSGGTVVTPIREDKEQIFTTPEPGDITVEVVAGLLPGEPDIVISSAAIDHSLAISSDELKQTSEKFPPDIKTPKTVKSGKNSKNRDFLRPYPQSGYPDDSSAIEIIVPAKQNNFSPHHKRNEDTKSNDKKILKIAKNDAGKDHHQVNKHGKEDKKKDKKRK